MSTYRARKQTADKGKFSNLKLLTTSALTAAGLLSLGINPALADGSWANLEQTAGAFDTDSANANVTNIKLKTDRAIGTGNADIYLGDTVNVDGKLFVVRDDRADPTQILGNLNSNGKVVIIDGNGVFFGKQSRVDVAGLVTTTGNIDNDQLMNNDFGDYTFSDVTSGTIELNGTVNITDSGLAAFVSPTVKNAGVINAKMGKVVMAAGETVTLDMYGDGLFEVAVDGELADAYLENTGVINAQGGTVQMTALAAKDVADNIINLDGVVDVSSATQVGGKIVLSGGNKGVVSVKGEVNASGAQGGGSVAVTGQNVEVAESATIQLNAGENGDGGDAYFYGNDYAIFRGDLLARGGAESGNGGEAEISGGESVGYSGFTDLSAANGSTGTLLIDPRNLTISNASFSGLIADFLSGGNADVNVNARALADTLAQSNVNLWATETLSTGSDIDLSVGTEVVGITYGPLFSGCFLGCPVLADTITDHDLTIAAPEINLLHDITLGTGGLNIYDLAPSASGVGIGFVGIPASGVDVDVVNLDGKIFKRTALVDPAFATLADSSQLDGEAHTVNVLSDDASIQQGIYFTKETGTVNLAATTFNQGNININKGLMISGAGKNSTIINATGFNTGFEITQDLGNNNVVLRRMAVENAEKVGISITDTANLKVLQLNEIAVKNSGYNGVAVRGHSMKELRILNSDFLDNGFAGSIGGGGDGDIVAYKYDGDVTLNNVTIENNDTTDAVDFGVQIRGELDGSDTAGKIVFDNVSIAGNFKTALIGIHTYSDIDSLSMNNVTLGGATTNLSQSTAKTALFIDNIGTKDLSIGNTNFLGGNMNYINNLSAGDIDATGATFDTADNFEIAAKILHKMQNINFGLVTWVEDNLFVIQKSKGIQHAINIADAGDTVNVDGTTYTENLTIDKELKLKGYGTTLEAKDPANALINVTASNVNIDPFTFDGLGLTNYGINATGLGAIGLVVDGNTFKNFNEAGIYLASSAAGTGDILNNTFEGSSTRGMQVGELDGGYTLNITDNTIGTNGDEVLNGLVFDEIKNATVNISGGSIDSAGGAGEVDGDGIHFAKGAGNGASIKISDLQIVSDTKEAIDVQTNLHAGSSFEIDGGSYTGGDDGIEFGAVSGHLTIKNATVEGQQAIRNGVNFYGKIRGIVEASGNTITGANNGFGSTKFHHNVVDGGSVILTDNTIIGTTGNAVEFGGIINGGSIDVNQNTLNAGSNGIQIHGAVSDASSAVINDNTINADESGVQFASDVTDSTVEITNNLINAAGTAGIAFSDFSFLDPAITDSLVIIRGNTIDAKGRNFVDFGMYFEGIGGSTELKISKNKVVDAGEDGILLQDAITDTAFVNIIQNTLGSEGNAIGDGGFDENGIDVDAVKSTRGISITKNKIYANGNAVEIDNDIENSNVAIKQNGILKGGENGISIEGDILNSEISIAKNDNIRAGINGIVIDGEISGNSEIGITKNRVREAQSEAGISVTDATFGGLSRLNIENNSVWKTGTDAIFVDATSNTVIENNYIGYYASGLTPVPGVNVIGGNGIHAVNANGIEITQNSIINTGNNGIYTNGGDILNIALNNVQDVENSGIEVNGSSNVTIEENQLTAAQKASIELSNADIVNVVNNNIFENGEFGLWARGSGNGSIALVGNTFTDNPTGARFESGAIDLTDTLNPNSFIVTPGFVAPSAVVGMQFQLADPKDPNSLTIVGRTLGATIFDGYGSRPVGQSYYVRFENGAILTAGGAVITIDGTFANWDGLVPNTLGNILTATQLSNIEDRLFDADDAAVNGRGQIFVGVTPALNIEDFIQDRAFGQFGTSGLNMLVTGLPPLSLNPANIEPAAGGDDGENPDELANIEPAAGGDDVACWGDAINSASAGTVVNYSYGGSLSEALADASACGSTF